MRKIRTIIGVICTFIFCSFSANAQTDTEFWFAAPEVSSLGSSYDRPIILYITTYGQKATVNLTQPAKGASLGSVTVPANETMAVNITSAIASLESTPANTILTNGLLITSTAPVTAYYDVVSGCNCNQEIFVLKGRNALGTDFWIPSQNYFDNWFDPASFYAPVSSFDIVASQNNTTVTITPSKNIVGHNAGIPFNIILNAGEVYSATAVDHLKTSHLEGSRVVSDKPIAITVKDDEIAHASCADLAGDQIVPVNILGTEYVAMLSAGSIDRLFVTATQNGTTISQDGTTVATINAGQTYMLTMSNLSSYISATKSVYVWHLSSIGCEMSASLLPPLGCTGNYTVAFTRPVDQSMAINLLVRNGGQSSFLVNGVPGIINSTQFSVVPGTSGLYYSARIVLPVTSHPPGSRIMVSNTAMMFHLGMLNGASGGGSRFGYFSDYGKISPVIWTNPPVCENDSFNMYTHSITGAQYTWSGPNNFTSNLVQPFIYPVTYAGAGTYTLKMDANGCSGSSVMDINVLPKPIVNVTPQVSYICPTDTMLLTAHGVDSFEWVPAYELDTNKGPVVKASPDITTTYYVIGKAENECTNKDSAKVIMNNVPAVEISRDSIMICPKDVAKLTVKGADSYTWSPATGLNTTTGTTVISSSDESILYTVIGKATNGCLGKDSVWVLVGDTVYAALDMIVCSDTSLRFGDTVVTDTGTYIQFFKTVAGCDSMVTLHVAYKPSPVSDFSFTPIIPVMNEPTQFLNNATGAISYYWDFGDKTSSIEKDPRYLFKRSGIYKVCLTVRNKDWCPDVFCKEVEADIYPNINVPDAFSPNGDGINDLLHLYGGGVQEVVFRVYNRWGQVVFEAHNMDAAWDGTVKGTAQAAEVFAYTLYAVFIDGTTYSKTGNITIVK